MKFIIKFDKLLIIFVAILFFYLIIISPLIAAAGIFICISILICIKIKIEHFLLFFILAYPMLPFHVGIDLGSFLPVVRLHRVLVLLLIVCWMSKKNLFSHTDSLFKFPLTNPS